MEMAGFARAGVPGEYSATPASTFLPTDVNNTVGYATILTRQVTIIEQGELLLLIGSLVSRQGATGGTPVLRFSIDGTALLGAAKTVSVGGASSNVRKVEAIDGLTPGMHTVTLDWRNAQTSSIAAASTPTQCHAVLLCQRSRVTSRREMDGFAPSGWSMIYTCGQTYQALASTNTSTSTTVTTPLFNVVAATRYAGSALLIRFSASGANNDPSGTLIPACKFQLIVDGVAQCGTGNDCQFQSGFFNAGFICIVPVLAGNHTIVVNWAGGAAPGTTIDPTVDGQHAFIAAEEVFCADVESLPDQEGFATYAFSARNLARVGYVSLQQDFTNGGGTVALLEKYFYVAGDNSAVTIEFTGSLQNNSVQPIMGIVVDGVLVHGTTETGNASVGIQCVSVEAAMPLCQGRHLIQVTMNGITTFSPVTNPTFSHANLVIRETATLTDP